MPIFEPFIANEDTRDLLTAATQVVTRMGKVLPLRTNTIGDNTVLSGGMTYRDNHIQIDAKLDELVISEIMPKGARRIVATISSRRASIESGEWENHLHSLNLMLTIPKLWSAHAVHEIRI
jgi:hypothetical protein